VNLALRGVVRVQRVIGVLERSETIVQQRDAVAVAL